MTILFKTPESTPAPYPGLAGFEAAFDEMYQAGPGRGRVVDMAARSGLRPSQVRAFVKQLRIVETVVCANIAAGAVTTKTEAVANAQGIGGADFPAQRMVDKMESLCGGWTKVKDAITGKQVEPL